MDPAPLWYSASVPVIIYVISYNIGPCYNSTRLYIHGCKGFMSYANLLLLPLETVSVTHWGIGTPLCIGNSYWFSYMKPSVKFSTLDCMKFISNPVFHFFRGIGRWRRWNRRGGQPIYWKVRKICKLYFLFACLEFPFEICESHLFQLLENFSLWKNKITYVKFASHE